MQAQSYYRKLAQGENNISDDSRYLAVNCTGTVVSSRPFRTFLPNGRKDYYMMYLVSGALHIASGDDTRDPDAYRLLSPGQLFVYPPNTAYGYEPADSQEIRYYWIHFTGFGAARLLADCTIPVGAIRTVGFPEGIEDHYRALFRTFILRTPNSETAAFSCFAGICALFGDAMRFAEQSSDGEHSDAGFPADPQKRLYTSVSYLHENLEKPLSVGQLAAMEHLSVSRYRERFRELMDVSPMDYITGLRISRACELLAQTDLPLSEIAVSVGYNDPQYFSRIFRAQTGDAPSLYRKLQKKS